MEKSVSVLMPAHSCSSCILRAVKSALSEPSVEVVIAPDDGSTEYDFLAKLYPDSVRVLSPTTRTGPASARNRAFSASSGQFITMLDADDALAPGALAQALDLAKSNVANISFFRTAYVDAESSGVIRELTRQSSLDFQEFSDFHGSIHALYARRHWTPYRQTLAEDVLHDAQMLLAAGGVAPMTSAPYLLYINTRSLSANTRQEAFNLTYRQIRDEATEPQIKALYQAKLDMGEAFSSSSHAAESRSFQSFVLHHFAKRTM